MNLLEIVPTPEIEGYVPDEVRLVLLRQTLPEALRPVEVDSGHLRQGLDGTALCPISA